MRGLLHDLRHATRQLTRRRAFTVVVVATLTLGIGANVAIFSVVDAVLLERLPYRQPKRLVSIYSQFPTLGFDKFWVSPPEYTELRRWATSFEEVGAYRLAHSNLSGGDEPQRVVSARVSASLWGVLGAEAARGRTFAAAEDLPDAAPVAVLGDGLWHRVFAADPGVVGAEVEVDGVRRTVVGVMPAGFDIENAGVDLYLPLALDPANPGGRANHSLYLVGRLADGVSLGSARAELGEIMARWVEEFPHAHHPDPERHALIYRPLGDELVASVRPLLLLLLGAVGLVLLVACANVANLLLARAATRRREVAVRTAVGASAGGLVRLALCESLLLAAVGGSLGLALAVWGARALLARYPEAVPRSGAVAVDGRVLAFAFAVTLLTGLLFGLAPTLQERAGDLVAGLREGGRTTGDRRAGRLRRSLVVAEVALAAVLAVAAGLLVKSLWRLEAVDPGFTPGGVLTASLYLPPARYPDARQVSGFYRDLVERLRALPGVEAVAAMSGLPPVREVNAMDTEFEGVPEDPTGPPHNVDFYQYVTPGYFRALRIAPLAGRLFTAADEGDAGPVAIINRTMAKTFWPDGDPLGRRVRPEFGDDTPWLTIVGVVDDVKQGGVDRPVGTELYFLSSQAAAQLGYGVRGMNLVLRTAGDPRALADAVRRIVRRRDPSLPLSGLRTLDEVVRRSLSRPRFLTSLVALFGLLALALAAVGTYGMLAFMVEERRHEMGVRMALGAGGGEVLGLVLGHGMRLVAVGLAAGGGAALAARRVLANQLYGVAPTDPETFAVVAVVLAVVALAACALPAMQAARTDPMVVLRAD